MVGFVFGLILLLPILGILLFFIMRCKSNNDELPRSYPLLGHLIGLLKNRKRLIPWLAEVVNKSASSTFPLYLPLRCKPLILTANPSNVRHILETRFANYTKGTKFRDSLHDLFGDFLFLAEGQEWSKLRKLVGHEVTPRSFFQFVQLVTDDELSNRLLPLLSSAAANDTVIDLQDIIRRFIFDVVFRMALGHDLAYLKSSSPNDLNFPQTKFADSLNSADEITKNRYLISTAASSLIWKTMRFFNVGSEKKLRVDVSKVRELIREIIRIKKGVQVAGTDNDDFVSGLIKNGTTDEEMLIDAAINFILAGVTIQSVLIPYFKSTLKGQSVEEKVVKEIIEKNDVRDMIYTHASILESMRLSPPVPLNGREATENDVLPDGTKVKKGTRVTYFTLAMGMSSELWGANWPEFLPERWLKRSEEGAGEWTFMERDSFANPVFHAGPRICLGKDIALMHIKTVVASVLRRFHMVPAIQNDHNPASQSTKPFLIKVVDRN